MQIRLIKRVQMGERILEAGYLVDTETMPFLSEEQATALVEEGKAEVEKPAKKPEQPKPTKGRATDVLNAILD